MLPEHRHKHDEPWLLKQLSSIPHSKRGMVAHKYSNAYQEAHEAEQVEHMKENKARFAANTRLRIYIEKTQARARR